MDKKQKILDLLLGVRQLISDPQRWLVGDFAEAVLDNQSLDTGIQYVNHPKSKRWCALGACIKVSHELYSESFERDDLRCSLVSELDQLTHSLYGKSLVQVNDQLGHQALLEILDLKIQNLKGTLSHG